MRDPATVKVRMEHAIRAARDRGNVDDDTAEWLTLCVAYATGAWSREHDAAWMDDAKLVAYDLDNWLDEGALTT